MVFGMSGFNMESVTPIDLEIHKSCEDIGQDTSGCESSGLDMSNAGRVEDKHTDRAIVQAMEDVCLEPYQKCRGKPMVELKAGSRLYYQATVAVETRNELKLVFPAVDESDAVRQEWVKKSSSRIWRGSLSRKVWKHKGKGAWEPKDLPKSRGKLKGRKRKATTNIVPVNVEKQRATDIMGVLAGADTDEGTFDENDMHLNDGRGSEDDPCHCMDGCRQSDGGCGIVESGQESSAFDASHLLEERHTLAGQSAQPMEALVAWFQAHIHALKGRGAMNSECVPACGPMAPLIRTKHIEATCSTAQPCSEQQRSAQANSSHLAPHCDHPNPLPALAFSAPTPAASRPNTATRPPNSAMQPPATTPLAPLHPDWANSSTAAHPTSRGEPAGSDTKPSTATSVAAACAAASFTVAGSTPMPAKSSNDHKPHVSAVPPVQGAAVPPRPSNKNGKPRRTASAGLRELVGLAPSDTWSVAQHEHRKRGAVGGGAAVVSASDSAGHGDSRQTGDRGKAPTSKSSSDAGKVDLAMDLRATSSSADVATSPCKVGSVLDNNGSGSHASARCSGSFAKAAIGSPVEGRGTSLSGSQKVLTVATPPVSSLSPPPPKPRPSSLSDTYHARQSPTGGLKASQSAALVAASLEV